MTEEINLVTGAAGFLGGYVGRHLARVGRQVRTLDVPGAPVRPDIECDLARQVPDLDGVRVAAVYHLAGLAHRVPRRAEEAEAFYAVNDGGTRHLLEGLDRSGVEVTALAFVSTVAVYGVTEGWLLSETTPRQACDPYGESKRRAEDAVLEWGNQRGIAVGIVRLPLVAGERPPGNLGAMIGALKRGWYLGVGDGMARRSLVWAEDVARILPAVAGRGGVYHLTDGVHPSYRQLEEAIAAALGRRRPSRIPVALARVMGLAGDALRETISLKAPVTTATVRKMTATLTFDDTKARSELGWSPSPVLDHVPEMVR